MIKCDSLLATQVVWGHAQNGLAVFASSLFRSPKLSTVLFYLVTSSGSQRLHSTA